MATLQAWMEAARPRTLVLSVSSILLGSFLAYSHNQFILGIALLAGITAILLQILSNLANDYGDYHHGADNKDRIGPKRTIQSGKIAPQEIKKAIIMCSVFAGFSGGVLTVLGTTGWNSFLMFGAIGMGAIIAAITYTSGKLPYGYQGLGDFFVFIFFGLVGVLGTYYLHTNSFSPLLMLPATSLGCLVVGVLNVNNMRDYSSDKKTGKKTQVVRIGYKNAKVYHALLLFVPFILTSSFVLSLENTWKHWLFLLLLPFLALHFHAMMTKKEEKLDNELRRLALITFAFSILLGIGINI